MKKQLLRWGAIGVLAGLIALSTMVAYADGTVPGYVLVRTQPGVSIQQLASDYGATVLDHVSGTDIYSLSLPQGDDEATFAGSLGGDARVAYSETDTFVTTPILHGDPFHFSFDGGPNPGTYVNQHAYRQVNAGRANLLTTGVGVTVAVLDTGVTFGHKALKNHLLPGYNALDPTQPPNDIPDGTTNVATGHGTMIAGIIAWMAPRAKILPVRVLNGDGVGTILSVSKGLEYAIAHGVKVINLSFGTTVKTSALNDILDNAESAGIAVVVAAGNDGENLVSYPAAGRGVIGVAAVEANNVKSPYSNYGSFVRVVAPGSGIRSTFWDGGFASWSGTSFAAPFVAAEAALLFAYRPNLTVSDVRGAIRASSRSVDLQNPAYKGKLGNGIINVLSALRHVR